MLPRFGHVRSLRRAEAGAKVPWLFHTVKNACPQERVSTGYSLQLCTKMHGCHLRGAAVRTPRECRSAGSPQSTKVCRSRRTCETVHLTQIFLRLSPVRDRPNSFTLFTFSKSLSLMGVYCSDFGVACLVWALTLRTKGDKSHRLFLFLRCNFLIG